MGWTSLHRVKGMTDRQFFETEFPDTLGTRGRIVACATMPGMGCRVFYAAVRNNHDIPHRPGETWALVVLMQRNPNSHWNFTYKDLTDNCGPAEDHAPASVLDALTPTDSEYANDWRARCRANLAAKAARPKVTRGDTVVFAAPVRFVNGDELAELEFVERNTFTRPGTGFRYQVPGWRATQYDVKAGT